MKRILLSTIALLVVLGTIVPAASAQRFHRHHRHHRHAHYHRQY